MADVPTALCAQDRRILRDLAKRKVELAESPANAARRELWYAHDEHRSARPIVLAESGPVLDELLPAATFQCQDAWARDLERSFHQAIYDHTVLKDDHVLEPTHYVPWVVAFSDYGVHETDHYADNHGQLGARTWTHPIADLDADFHLLKPRTFSVDRPKTLARKAFVEDLLGDILEVQIRGSFYWTLGMTWTAIRLVGLQEFMLYMYDNPAGLHRLMAFLRDDHLKLVHWLTAEGLYTPNDRNDYIGSGTFGYSHAFPAAPNATSATTPASLWVLLESQETVGVSPELFAEFVLPYQTAIAQEFGRVYYGCCEPLHTRIDLLKKWPNLQRVSVSPWADQTLMGQACGQSLVFSRKPNPTFISSPQFDEGPIRADLKETLQVAKHNTLELIMKDVHTLCGDARRLPRWIELAREGIEEFW